MSDHPKDHYDQCSGCGRYCFARRVVQEYGGLEVQMFCVAPWAARVLSRRREIPTDRASGILSMGEYGVVCSLNCLRQMLKDPAWEYQAPEEGLRMPTPTICVGEDRLAHVYGSRGLIPALPQNEWVLLDSREDAPSVSGAMYR